MGLNLKPGVKVVKFVPKFDGFKAIRTSPEIVEVIDRITTTISNEASRNAETANADRDFNDEATFDIDGAVSKGRRGRYRGSVRTSNFEAVFAEHHDKSLSKALTTVIGKIGGQMP